MALSATCLSLMNVFVKLLAPIYPAFEIISIRYVVCAAVLFAFLKVSRQPFVLGKSRNAVIAHGVTGVLAIFCLVKSLSMLPMAIAIMLYWCCPIFVLLFSKMFTGEGLSKRGLAFMALTFTGLALFVVEGGMFSGASMPVKGVFIGLCGAALAGVAYVSLRIASQRIQASVVVFYASIIAVMIAVPAALLAGFEMPSAQHLTMMLLIGGFSLVGQFALTKSYAYASAPLASCMALLNIAFSAAAGSLFFGENLTAIQSAGMLLLNCGIVFVTLASSKKAKIANSKPTTIAKSDEPSESASQSTSDSSPQRVA